MFLKDLNKFNSDFLDGKHASNSGGSVPILDSNAKLPLAQIPTGSTKDTVSLGNHTHAYAGSSSVGGAATSALKCTGNSATATALETARTINGTSFNGSANITTSNWGTSRTLTIGKTGKSVNGSGNVSWSLTEIGAAADSHTHDYLPLSGGTMTGHINMNASKGIYGTTTGDVTTTDGTTYNGTLSILMYNGSNNLHVGAGIWDKKINQGNTYISGGTNTYIRTIDPNGEIGFQIGGSSRLKLNDSGTTLLKPLTMSKNSVAGAINFTKTDGTQVTGLYLTSGDKIKLGNDSTSTYIYSSTNPKVNVGGASTSHYIYHEGNKPKSIDFNDTRSVNHAPLSMPDGISLHLKQKEVDGITEGFYHPVLEMKSWNDMSGGPFAQMTITQAGRMWYRESTDGENNWNNWHKVYSTIDMPKPGNWWSDGALIVRDDGVTEVGRYIDWHETNESTADYDARLSCSNGVICCNNSIQARGLLSTLTSSGSKQANVCYISGSNKILYDDNGFFFFYSKDNDTSVWSTICGYNTYSRLGNDNYRWHQLYLKEAANVSSDRTLKENINYIRNNDVSTASTYSLRNTNEEKTNTNNSTNITYSDMYNFVRDDLELATYNFAKKDVVESDSVETMSVDDTANIERNPDDVEIKNDSNTVNLEITERDIRLGFIAQDLLYNEDQTDNKVGQFIVTPSSVEEDRALDYNEADYINVLAGALKQAINEIEILKIRLEELEGGI